LVLAGVYHQSMRDSKSQLVIFHTTRNSLITIKENTSLRMFTTDTVEVINRYPIKSYKTANNIRTVQFLKFQNVFNYKKKLFVIIDSTGAYSNATKKAVILLTQSPKLNLERLIDSLHPIQIIADGNNYKSYVKRWKATCIHKKIPFHSTYEKGAYFIE
jgi:competence protein ComEC